MTNLDDYVAKLGKPNLKVPRKKVKMSLVGIDGNAYAILGAFQKNARSQGWTKTEIEIVIKKAIEKDYDHLLQTIIKYTEEIE